MQRVFSLCLIGLLAFAGPASAGTLTVTGQGSASAVPDMATMTMGVSHEAANPQNAMEWVTRDINSVFSRLRDAGIEERDLQTSQISLYPVWSRADREGKSTVSGFSASVNMRVVLRDLDRLGDILDEVLDAGGNRFNGMTLGIQDTASLQTEARVAAIADARMKAADYAEAAEVTLQGIVSISENGGGGSPYPALRMADAAMSMESLEVARGESAISQTVTVVFEFE